jgi:hypothetical protein
MRTRITRPTLPELWRVLLAFMEALGAEDAPALARSLAVAGLTGRPAEAMGVRVEPRGQDVLIVARERSHGRRTSDVRHVVAGRARARRRCRTMVTP